MTDVLRTGAEEARTMVAAGAALLVCAYESDEKFEKVHLEGAIPLTEFRNRLPDLPSETRIIFYCA